MGDARKRATAARNSGARGCGAESTRVDERLGALRGQRQVIAMSSRGGGKAAVAIFVRNGLASPRRLAMTSVLYLSAQRTPVEHERSTPCGSIGFTGEET